MPESELRLVHDLERIGALRVEDGNHGEYRPRPDEFVREGVAFIRAADLESGRVLFERAERINETARGRIRKGVGQPGDVLLSHKGTVGKVALAPLGCEPFVCSPQTTFWRAVEDSVLEGRYLYYFLQSPPFRAQLEARQNESDMAAYVSLTQQRQLAVLVPPIRTQRAIAAVLGALDDKIELNRRMNRTLEAICDRQFENSLGKLPPTGSIQGVIRISRASIDPSQHPDEQFEHFSIPAFDQGRVPAVEPGREIRSTKFEIPPHAVLLSKLNPRFPRVWLPETDTGRRAIASTEYVVSTATPPFTREYVYLLFRSQSFQDDFVSLVTGTSGSHQRVKPADLLVIATAEPDDASIARFTARVSPLLSQVQRNLRESRTLAALRDSLLPKLISGGIRVRGAEKAVDAAT